MFKTFPQMMAELPKSRVSMWHTVTLPWGSQHSVFVRGTDDAQMTPSPKRAAKLSQPQKLKGGFASKIRFAADPSAPVTPTTRTKRGFAGKIRFGSGIQAFKIEGGRRRARSV